LYTCLCFPNVYATSPNKLSPRSLPCVLLGFSFEHKGYSCLDLLTGHVHVLRHITFAENMFPFAQPNSTTTSTPTTTSSTSRFPFHFSPDPAPPATAAEPAENSIVAPNDTE
jgi:hypothetical protein